jgi:YesN/AraC family two-component response regulator
VVLTLGSNGCIYSDSLCEFYQPAFKVNAVDTTAAGDTFTGYFIAGLSRGSDYQTILKMASAASAIAVSRKGAAPSIPDKSEVLSSLQNLKENILNSKSDIMRKQIDRYIEKNIKNANLEELSAILGYSVVYTGSLVKKLTGESFTKKVQAKRCTIVAEKLLNTDLPVGEIIADLGYENESFFRKIFKGKYGENPLDYRKNRLRN